VNDERLRLSRLAAEGDVQACMRLLGLLMRDKAGDEFSAGSVWKIRRRSDGAYSSARSYGDVFAKGHNRKKAPPGKSWGYKSSAMAHIRGWFKRKHYDYNTNRYVERRDDRYEGCDLVRFITLEVEAQDVMKLCEERWGKNA